jgi:hypothetical protein
MVINYRRRSLWLVRVLGGPYESGFHDLQGQGESPAPQF